MAVLYVLASIPNQGKTTTAILLEKNLKEDGKRVACLQMNKDKNDVYRYISEGCSHYTIPLEASQTRETFEKWVPKGYDSYILELTYGFSPTGFAYISLFDPINEIVSFEYRENWRLHVENSLQKTWVSHYPGIDPPSDLMSLWQVMYDRTVQQIVTKTPEKRRPSVDQNMILHGREEFAVEHINPEMALPQGKNKVISVGVFPPEYWDIFPALQWFDMDYAGFMDAIRKNEYDLAIIGGCGTERLKLNTYPDKNQIICYQPSVFLDLKPRRAGKSLHTDIHSMYETIKLKPPGTPLSSEGEPFSGYNNQYWVYRLYDKPEVVWREENILFCNGWVLPQYLIRDGYLEVN